MKTERRFKRKVRALHAQKIGLLRELAAMQAQYERVAKRHHPASAGTKK